MPGQIASTALECTPKVVSAISGTQQAHGVLSTVARTARLLDGQWIPEAVASLPGAQQSLKFFGKVVEKPIAAISHQVLSSYVKKVIRKQLHTAKDSLTSNSLVKSAANYVLSTGLSYLPGWAQSVATPLVETLGEMAMEQLASKMFDMLDPIINAPTADLIAKRTGHLAAESVKFYVGHKIQVMVIAYIAEQLKDSEYTTLSTTVNYAKQADDYRVTASIFTLLLAANILPYLADRLFSSEESIVKAKLKEYVLSKSGIDRSTITGKVYSAALDATIENLIQSKVVSINQLKITLATVDIAESVQSYCK